MLAAMRAHVASGTAAPQIPTAVCNALRRIAVNDQICMDFADAGGVTVTMQVAYAKMLNVDLSPSTKYSLACLLDAFPDHTFPIYPRSYAFVH